MPHPKVDNETPLVVTPLFLDDENARPALTIVLRVVFDILDRGVLAVMEEQPTLCAAGEFWGDPETSSYRYEPEIAPLKLATDVAVVASAWAPNAHTTVLDAGIRVGPLSKGLRVIGDRMWYGSGVEAALTKPLPFERIPVSYDRAFGGWDRSALDPAEHDCELRNPSGRGYHAKNGRMREHDFAPNIEVPGAQLTGYRDRPVPTGIGFTSPHWQPRAQLAGTYDKRWSEERKPRLPSDFDPRFFSAASPGLVADGYLRGDEQVHAVNLTPAGRSSLQLPAIPPPSLRLGLAGEQDKTPLVNLDTVIIDLETMRLTLIWRARISVREGPNDLRVVEVSSPTAARFPRSHSATPAVAANAGFPR